VVGVPGSFAFLAVRASPHCAASAADVSCSRAQGAGMAMGTGTFPSEGRFSAGLRWSERVECGAQNGLAVIGVSWDLGDGGDHVEDLLKGEVVPNLA
jgi:hypothetical protein